MPSDKTVNPTFLRIDLPEAPDGVDSRAFLTRSAAISSTAVLTGCPAEEKATQPVFTPPPAPSPALAADLSPDLNVVKKSRRPVTTIEAPESVLAGLVELRIKAVGLDKRALDDKYRRPRGLGALSAYELAGCQENAPDELVIRVRHGNSAGGMPALVYEFLWYSAYAACKEDPC